MSNKNLVRLVASFLRAQEETKAEPDPGNKEWQSEMARFTEDDLELPIPSTYSQVEDSAGRNGVIR